MSHDLEEYEVKDPFGGKYTLLLTAEDAARMTNATKVTAPKNKQAPAPKAAAPKNKQAKPSNK